MGGISERVQSELKSWPEVTLHNHQFGGLEFRVNGKEIGRLHGDLADLPSPADARKRRIAEGKALPHHFTPKSNWLSYNIEKTEDVDSAIGLFRMQYERPTGKNKEKWRKP